MRSTRRRAVEMHEIDAARLAVKHGRRRARLVAARVGACCAWKSPPKARPGVVFIPMHFSEAAANLLTIDALDPQAKIPEFKACAVDIQIADQTEAQHLPEQQVRGRY
jgi:predicted molibdopterin-dependent oxidoreductase YjgC